LFIRIWSYQKLAIEVGVRGPCYYFDDDGNNNNNNNNVNSKLLNILFYFTAIKMVCDIRGSESCFEFSECRSVNVKLHMLCKDNILIII